MNSWKLHGYIIQEREGGGLLWAALAPEDSYIVGKCFMPEEGEPDNLFMSSWKVRDGDSEGMESFAPENYDPLPPWEKTKFYSKMVDVGPTAIFYCANGEMITPEDFEVAGFPEYNEKTLHTHRRALASEE